MKKLKKAGIAFVLCWFFLTNAYVMVTHIDGVLEEHADEIPITFLAPLYSMAVVGIAADVAFNAVPATIMFQQLPSEWTFSERVNDNLDHPDFDTRRKAREWCALLDLFDEGHCNDYRPPLL